MQPPVNAAIGKCATQNALCVKPSRPERLEGGVPCLAMRLEAIRVVAGRVGSNGFRAAHIRVRRDENRQQGKLPGAFLQGL